MLACLKRANSSLIQVLFLQMLDCSKPSQSRTPATFFLYFSFPIYCLLPELHVKLDENIILAFVVICLISLGKSAHNYI